MSDKLTNKPVEDYSAGSKKRFLFRLTAVLIGGMFLDGYILGIIGTVIGRIGDDLGVSEVWEGLIAASALLSLGPGAVILKLGDQGCFYSDGLTQLHVFPFSPRPGTAANRNVPSAVGNADQPWLLVNRDPFIAVQDDIYVGYDDFGNGDRVDGPDLGDVLLLRRHHHLDGARPPRRHR